ncbi:aldose 1-epimerase family protein [Tellurirhabdus bombi]|uniref:aldose 1-epimerase family protein n=1 Tax=Tellurirhabdus bombi TaxID=2907205 RepID=UPI001F409629|nr:aldose 1-epimerase family protein [Tellurirhabdus bombi]
MTTLENDFLRVLVRPKGAELTSIFHKPTNTEHLWQADEAIWGWHAPNLFPVVGGCLDDQLLIDEQTYSMERHGFARKSTFSVIESTPEKAVFSLKNNADTELVYPYRFDFQVEYQLDGPVLTVVYRVLNEDNKTIYFSVGAHPAFAVPFSPNESYEDYLLEFQKEEPLERHLLSPKGYFTGETSPILAVGNQLPLTRDLFDQDALVFKNLDSRRVTIRSRHHDHCITVTYPPFPYLGIWAKPGAPFVCIEPWLGCADSEGMAFDISQKEAIQHVDAGELFEAGFTIGIQ